MLYVNSIPVTEISKCYTYIYTLVEYLTKDIFHSIQSEEKKDLFKSGGVTNPLTEATNHIGEVTVEVLTDPDCKELKTEVHVHTLQVIYISICVERIRGLSKLQHWTFHLTYGIKFYCKPLLSSSPTYSYCVYASICRAIYG